MNAQEIVAANVAARGYRDGWTTEQFVARQLAKVTEELAEAAYYVDADSFYADLWFQDVLEAGASAREAFGRPEEWKTASIANMNKVCSELADIIIPLFALAQALGLDLVQAAIDKSGADVERGVR